MDALTKEIGIIKDLQEIGGFSSSDMTLGHLADFLQRTKDAKTGIGKLEKAMNKAKSDIEFLLIKKMEAIDVEKITGELTTVTKKADLKAGVDDKEAFIRWCYENSRFEFIQSKVNQAPVKEMLELENIIPTGVSTWIYTKINTLRRK